jgi:uracil-DNA glycosylase family 4
LPADPSPSPNHASFATELAEIARGLRAQIERFEASGAWGLPPSPTVVSVVPSRPSPPSAGSSSRAPVPVAASALPAHAVRNVAVSSERAGIAPTGRGVATAPLGMTDTEVRRLEVVAEAASRCTRCALHEGRTHSVFARGSGKSGVAFIGEGPGEEEDRQGEPFVGPAGQLLDRMIAAMQLSRDDVYVCNIVKCRPPRNRKPEPAEMSECMPFLVEQLDVINPRVIVALGATAVQGLLGTTEGITRLRGQWKLYRGKIPVMPTFHPAYLLRQPQAKREVWKDLQDVLRQLSASAPPVLT